MALAGVPVTPELWWTAALVIAVTLLLVLLVLACCCAAGVSDEHLAHLADAPAEGPVDVEAVWSDDRLLDAIAAGRVGHDGACHPRLVVLLVALRDEAREVGR